MEAWLGLVIGNSRLHWALFERETLKQTWDSDHITISPVALPDPICQTIKTKNIPIYVTSVVPEQMQRWETCPHIYELTLDDIPLRGMYPTFGRDRALALFGAIKTYGYPSLVIDAGTALTFTGAGHQQEVIGGAILPGLRLQFQALSQNTAVLPLAAIPPELPPRWAHNTTSAIQSGILYTVLAGIKDFITSWWQDFPASPVILTGGDGHLLTTYLQAQSIPVTFDPNLPFWGMKRIISLQQK